MSSVMSHRKRRRRRSALGLVTPITVLSSLIIVATSAVLPFVAAQQHDPQTLNGGSVLAMAGKGCVAVAVDKRFGSGPQTINVSPRHVLAPHPSLLVAFTGLEGDVRSLAEELSVQISAKIGRSSGFGFEDELDDDQDDNVNGGGFGVPVSSSSRRIAPWAMAALTSHVLYGRRSSPYFVEPIVAGLERVVVADEGDKSKVQYLPFLCSHDMIGAQSKSDSFVCSGAASKSMYGTAQALWQPELEPEKLARVCGRAFLSALERDCLSGYGAIVYLISGDGDGCTIVEYDLACRND